MFDTVSERFRALGFGLVIANWPRPDGTAEIDAGDRVYTWGSFHVPTPSPYYIPDYVARAKRRLIEQFQLRRTDEV